MEFQVIRNDISAMAVNAIVLPANSHLKEGSGCSTAIYEKAGRQELEKACKEIIKKSHQIHTGCSVPTLGFGLDSDYIIHTVVPKWINGKSHEYELLSSAYLSALELADMLECESIALPLLASGNNGFNLRLSFAIAQESIEAYNATNKLRQVYLVLYGMRSVALMRELNIPVTEYIDEKYVLAKDEHYHSPIENIAQEAAKWGIAFGKHVGKQFLNDGLEMAKAYFDNPDNRKKIIDGGIAVAGKVLAKGKQSE